MIIRLPDAKTLMSAELVGAHSGTRADRRREYTVYLAQCMRPAIHALMLVALFGYAAALVINALAVAGAAPLWLQLLPTLPLLLLAGATSRSRSPLALSLLTLTCVLTLEIACNLNALGRVQALPWVMPGTLLVPIGSAVVWLARWDFIAAMLLCAIGPLPMLLYDRTSDGQVLPYLIYMVVAIALASVLRAFMTRTLFAQFQLQQRLREQAHTDGLTGLLVRNRFLDLAHAALEDPSGKRWPAGLMYVDADHFKQLNDNHGHAAGDAALVALADMLRGRMRQGDLIGRIGGEEFALLLPGLDLQQTCQRAEQLRVAMHAIRRPDGPLTVSIGVAASTAAGENIEALLARADKALRKAKHDGRDRVAIA
jgi:diguanylate cyclase (GGDEF)-like protein